jgi:hypothetical protein
MATKPPLKNIIKGILHTEDENKQSHERIGLVKTQKTRKVIREYDWISCIHTNLYTTKKPEWQELPHTIQY